MSSHVRTPNFWLQAQLPLPLPCKRMESKTRARPSRHFSLHQLRAVHNFCASFILPAKTWHGHKSSSPRGSLCMQHTRSIFAMLFYFRFLCIVLLCPNFCIILLLIVNCVFPPMFELIVVHFLPCSPDVFYSQNFSNVVLWITNAYSPPLCTKH